MIKVHHMAASNIALYIVNNTSITSMHLCVYIVILIYFYLSLFYI